ncbi:MAG TPA: methyltransferase domain-containing protein, partial [Blastococcus sp.]|nr:methyltransferase domain-containing protein [Blastococcus sp.]
MTSSTGTATDADRALKAKHRSMWASGNYPKLAADLLPELGEVLVRATGVTRGDRVLDVAAGSGNVAITAARTGASVIASDLTPELFEDGRVRAAAEGVELEWREADAEALPFADGEFDVVLSAIGVMFAPHHQAAADELVRVCRPGGRIGIISWTPEGFIGQLFATMKPYAPPPPPGASPPPKWGSEEHVLGL